MKETIKYLREKNNYSQTELAAHLGISRQMYIKYENGEVEPSVAVVKKLSQLYKIDYSEIIDNSFKKLYKVDLNLDEKIDESGKAYLIEKDDGVSYPGLTKFNSGMIVSEPEVSYKVSGTAKNLISKSYDIAYTEVCKLKYDELFKLLSEIVRLMEKQKEKSKFKPMTKEESMAFFEEFSGCIKNPELADKDYKELMYEALDEKYVIKASNTEETRNKNGNK